MVLEPWCRAHWACFWWLDLPAPILWGSAMAVLAIIPVVGTAIIWGPAAILLPLEGSPEKAMMSTAWGLIVIGLIDNVLNPAIVQHRLRVHIVPVFVSILVYAVVADSELASLARRGILPSGRSIRNAC